MIYANTFPQPPPKFGNILRWKLKLGPREEHPPELTGVSAEKLTAIAPDLKAIQAPNPEHLQVTWIGHSTFLIQQHLD